MAKTKAKTKVTDTVEAVNEDTTTAKTNEDTTTSEYNNMSQEELIGIIKNISSQINDIKAEQKADKIAAEKARKDAARGKDVIVNRDYSKLSESQKASEEKGKEMVEITLHKDDMNYSRDVKVNINGNTYIIQRGIPVVIPSFVAEVIERSEKADIITKERMAKLAEEFKAKADEMEGIK